ncbi:hypothetical protein IFT77_16310 [Frigoribacterium sp. CFBP 13729]|uniref:hypothetical protein n=1 Tax=Frigoribacterium sp. CFBP 13729 TaxID=2775293 RepID=UPI0017833730|nr:hypothetical protein [Frigoribacterium sp. CFBP 13729]MBD8612055.1 hypothetical protein [Frigoribacterium sp. CFBP 13729]
MILAKASPAGPGVVPVVKRAAIGLGVVALLVFWGLCFLFESSKTSGDVPAAAAMRFPAGSVVVDTEKHCRADRCWSAFYVAPPPGMTATELTAEIEGAGVGPILGSFSDPRFVYSRATLNGLTVHVVGRYW